jgi:methylated-DNA-[protein]-cysteine S-methyltransferase
MDAPVPVGTAAYSVFDTPIGACAVVWRDARRGLCAIYLPEADVPALHARVRRRFPGATERGRTPECDDAVRAIVALLHGRRDDDLCWIALDMRAIPEFNRRVYDIARAIPPGHTRSYGEIAADLGDAGLARPVGQALGANPFPIVVPCHRVLAAGHRPGGFSAPGGLVTKLRLLEIERAPLGGSPGLFD